MCLGQTESTGSAWVVFSQAPHANPLPSILLLVALHVRNKSSRYLVKQCFLFHAKRIHPCRSATATVPAIRDSTGLPNTQTLSTFSLGRTGQIPSGRIVRCDCMALRLCLSRNNLWGRGGRLPFSGSATTPHLLQSHL